MKRKILPILLLITLLASLCFGVIVGATEPHGLSVTKAGGTATEGSDYTWVTKTDAPDELHIKTNGLTVSGTGVHERIVADAGVTSLTLDNVTIMGCDTAVTIADNGTCTLTLVGTSTFGVNKTTGFDGSVTPSDWTDGVNKGIACAGKLILSGTGSINFLCATEITTPCFDPQNGTDKYYKNKTTNDADANTNGSLVFLGWFTESVNGNKVDSGYTAGNTYFAHWATPTGLTYTAETNNTVTTYGTAVTDKTVGAFTVTNSNGELTAEITTATQNGVSIEIDGKVSITVSGTDVVVSIAANANAGTYNYKVSNGRATGDKLLFEKNGTIVISPKTLTIADVTVDYETEKIYTGAELTFVVRGVTTTDGTAVTYTVSDNKATNVKHVDDDPTKDVTTYEMTITFSGNYSGSVKKTFKVMPKVLKNADISASVTDQTYTGKEITPQIKTTGGLFLVKDVDYTADYLYNINPTTASRKATVLITPCGNYTGEAPYYSRQFNIVVDKYLTGIEIPSVTDQTYTGKQITPILYYVCIGDDILISGTDYSVVYGANVEVGKGTITINVNNSKYKGNTTIFFNINKKTITAADVDDIPDQIYTGQALFPAVVVRNGGLVLATITDYYLAYSNNKEIGKASVTIDCSSSLHYTGNVTKEFNIVNKPTANSIATISDVVYNGSEQKPNVTVTLAGKTLTAGSDYTVEYKDNINAGTAKVVFTFKGDFAGIVIEKTFTIKPKAMTVASIANIGRQLFENRAVTPTLTINDGARKLTLGVDYTVQYQSNTDIGDAKAIVTFIGNYSGTAEKTFKIYVHNYSLSEIPPTMAYTGLAIEPPIIVSDNEFTLSLRDYVVQYVDNVNVGTATVYVTLQAPYSGLLTQTFVITPKTSLSADNVSIADGNVYTGAELKPVVIVEDGAVTLTEGEDYTVTYADNVTVGTATVTVTLQGNYVGTLTKTFAISAKTMNESNVLALPEVYYNGTAQTPTFTVIDGEKTLTANVDYEVSYVKNVNAGTAYAKVAFIGNYTGSATCDFKILPFPANQLDPASLTTAVYVADGNPCEPGVILRRNGESLFIGTDYDMVYVNNEEPGIAHIELTFKGNYVGTMVVDYIINAAMLSSECEENGASVVSVTIGGGFDPAISLVAGSGSIGKRNRVTGITPIIPLNELCALYEKAVAVYSVQLQKDGTTVQPSELSGDVVMALLIPNELAGKDFRLFHVHTADDVYELTLGDTPTVGVYAITEYGYILTLADELSDFVFIYQPACYFHWIACGVAALYLLAFALLTFVIVKKKWPIFVAGGVCAAGAAAIAVFGHCMLDLYIACGVGFLVILGTLFTILSLFLPKKKDGEKAQKPAKPQKEKKPKKEKQPKKDKKAQAAAENAEAAEQTPAEESVAASVDPYDNDTAAGGATAETAEAAEAAEAAAPEGDENADAGDEAGDGKKRHRRTKAEMEAARAEEAARLEELAAQGIVPEEKEKRHRRTKAEMEAARAEEAARLEELAAQGIVPEEKEKRHRRTKAEMEAARAAEAAAANGDAAAIDEPAENDVDVVEIDLGNADDNAPVAETVEAAAPVETVEAVEAAETVETTEAVEPVEPADAEAAADADSFDNA